VIRAKEFEMARRISDEMLRIRDIQWGEQNPYQKIADAFSMSDDFGETTENDGESDGEKKKEDLVPLFFATLRYKLHEAVHEDCDDGCGDGLEECGVQWFDTYDVKGDFTESYNKDVGHFSHAELRHLNQLAHGFVVHVEQKMMNLEPIWMMNLFKELDRQIMSLGSYLLHKKRGESRQMKSHS
jgi:hypothetical protein